MQVNGLWPSHPSDTQVEEDADAKSGGIPDLASVVGQFASWVAFNLVHV
jgi:hypothetical protein